MAVTDHGVSSSLGKETTRRVFLKYSATGAVPADTCPLPDLQTQYGNYKSTLKQIGQKIGDVEQEAEEHK